MKVIVSHPTSNQFNRALVYALYKENMLHQFHTSIAAFPNDFFYKLSKLSPFKEITRRQFESYINELTVTSPFTEFGRLVSSKLGLKSLTKHELGVFSVDSVYRNLDKKVSSVIKNDYDKVIKAVYAYDDGAINSFMEAKKHGLKCYYDLPIAYWKTSKLLLQEEAERLPEWADTLIGGITDSNNKLNNKEKELELADVIIVPSNFVKHSLPDWTLNKEVIMTPFGTPKVSLLESKNLEVVNEVKPLRVLFVGSMSQRKGLGDLFTAINLIDSREIELVVLGSLQAPLEFYKNKVKNFTYEKGRHHNEVLELMRTCDIFCLPSIIEGRALVMQEAMSQGLPIIITPNTGGEDLVIEGKTGFIVPIRSPEMIADRIIWFNENRSKIREMGRMAQQHASKYTWEKYTNAIIDSLKRS
jgi:glycosyltransferase involved in cell wall biosynthesis